MTAALPARPAGAAVHFNRGNDAEPETLDPQRSSTLAEAHILRDLFEGLLIQDRAGELAPGAAESWAVSADALTYTFKLRHEE
jgi:oligopeptide transport system substrate-binding protein